MVTMILARPDINICDGISNRECHPTLDMNAAPNAATTTKKVRLGVNLASVNPGGCVTDNGGQTTMDG